MSALKIRGQSQPSRCEICHQNDLFNPQTNHCTRCAILIDLPIIQPAQKSFSLSFRQWYQKHYQAYLFAIIFVPVISGVLLAMILPNIGTRCGRPGASAIESMRLFHSVQATYQSGIGDGKFATASEMFHQDFIDPVLAEASGVPVLESIGGQHCEGRGRPKSGYFFYVIKTDPTPGHPARFYALGIATEPDAADRYLRNFYVDETGIIRASTTATVIPDANSTPLNN